MKKNISINISGIIFHIEEDGYDRLKYYLDSIQSYFSGYEDSSEIIADIENRIAEIFLAKLKDGKQVITAEDVEALIKTMGNITDFAAMEEDPNQYKDNKYKSYTVPPTGQPVTGKRLYRDASRKLLGGVAAGIANYLSVDPIWFRLLFIVLFLTGGFGIIIYIVMWIAVPESYTLEEDKLLKKMYRDPENRYLAGVAGGIAAYFSMDVMVTRLIFVILAFIGGSGIVIYLVLWIITPEAKTLTERMQMEGQKVTLSNIEATIKRNFNEPQDKEESPLTKIILFPFRLIAIVFEALGKVLGPIFIFILEAFRILIGLVLSLTGIAFLVTFIITAGVLFGLFTGNYFIQWSDFPVEILQQSVPVVSLIAAFIFLFLTAVALMIAGIAIIVKKKIMNATVAGALSGVWILSFVVVLFTVPAAVRNFRSEGEYRTSVIYEMNGKTPVLQLRPGGIEDYDGVKLKIRGYNGSALKLEQVFASQGSSWQNAVENAKMIDYSVTQKDSVVLFDSNIKFKEGSVFRAQQLEMTLFVPYNQPFVIREGMKEILYETLSPYGYHAEDLDNTWIFTEDGLDCTTCSEESDWDGDNHRDMSQSRGYSKEYEFENFRKVKAGNSLYVEIKKGNEYKVVVYGNELQTRRVNVRQDGDVLSMLVNVPEEKLQNVKVMVIMPEIEELTLNEDAYAYVKDFDGDFLNIHMFENSKGRVEAETREMNLQMYDRSSLRLQGKTDNLNADLQGGSQLSGYEFESQNATIKAFGNSKATINAQENLFIQTDDSGNVRHKGTAKVTRDGVGYHTDQKEEERYALSNFIFLPFAFSLIR